MISDLNPTCVEMLSSAGLRYDTINVMEITVYASMRDMCNVLLLDVFLDKEKEMSC